jgi:hypothetical protein
MQQARLVKRAGRSGLERVCSSFLSQGNWSLLLQRRNIFCTFSVLLILISSAVTSPRAAAAPAAWLVLKPASELSRDQVQKICLCALAKLLRVTQRSINDLREDVSTWILRIAH